MPFLVETDLLLALISPEDAHHGEAKSLVNHCLGHLRLSPYSMVELDLLLRSKDIVVKDPPQFYTAVNKLLEYEELPLVSPSPVYHGEGHRLRKKYPQLTYFDSLHAAVAITEDLKLISYDSAYPAVGELNHSYPREHL